MRQLNNEECQAKWKELLLDYHVIVIDCTANQCLYERLHIYHIRPRKCSRTIPQRGTIDFCKMTVPEMQDALRKLSAAMKLSSVMVVHDAANVMSIIDGYSKQLGVEIDWPAATLDLKACPINYKREIRDNWPALEDIVDYLGIEVTSIRIEMMEFCVLLIICDGLAVPAMTPKKPGQ